MRRTFWPASLGKKLNSKQKRNIYRIIVTVFSLKQWNYEKDYKLLRDPVDKQDWKEIWLAVSMVNAFYDPSMNSIQVRCVKLKTLKLCKLFHLVTMHFRSFIKKVVHPLFIVFSPVSGRYSPRLFLRWACSQIPQLRRHWSCYRSRNNSWIWRPRKSIWRKW